MDKEKALEEMEKTLSQWVDKLKRGENLADIRKWFLKIVNEATLPDDYVLTPLNKTFWDAMLFNFEEWKRRRVKH